MGDPGPGPDEQSAEPADAAVTGSGDADRGDPVVHQTAAARRTATAEAPPAAPRARGPWNHSPFVTGFLLAAGGLLAWWFGGLIIQASSILILVVVALFIAFGLNPVVQWLIGHNIRHSVAVLLVALGFVAALALFIVAIAPVVADQISTLTENAPGYFDQLQHNRQIEKLDAKYDVIDKAKDYVTSGDLTQQVFGGVLGVGLAILGALANVFIVIVMTLYFMASLDTVKRNFYRLAPASRRETVADLGDRILDGIGGYVSGAFIVALCAGLTTLIFLFAVGLGQYAVALALVVAILDVIPMIGATLGAVIVSAIGFATDLKIGIACVIFYIVYQQVENYLIYPRVMSRSVDISGAMTVIAALIGASLLGVIGALLAIPTAAAIMLLVRELFVKRQDQR
ncbi:MAG: AI-2E family transporter [Marmoricola sp.]